MATIKAGTYTSTLWNNTNGLAHSLSDTPIESGVAYSLNFSSNGEDFTSMTLNSFSYSGGEIYYGSKLVGEQPADEVTEPYNSNYRIITIPKDQDVDDNFAPFLVKFYGVEEAEPTPTDVVTIEYNGAVIASLKAGQSATLPCKDKPMLSDVVVTVPEGLGGSVEEWDGSYTVSGGGAHTVTVTLTNPSDSSYFDSCIIYDGKDGNIVGEIDTPTGSATVETTTGQLYVYFPTYNLVYFTNDDVSTTGDIVFHGELREGSSNNEPSATFTVTGDGTITINRVDYYD